MKNTIIAIMTIIIIFLLMNTLDVFKFGSIIERDYRPWIEKSRSESVNKSQTFQFAIGYDNDPVIKEAVDGVEVAFDMINSKGGIMNKKLTLVKRNLDGSSVDYSNFVQEFCDYQDVAGIIGPFYTSHIAASRSISQLQGMPLISPLAVCSELLPKLKPDNFISFFPPLEEFAKELLKDLNQRKIKNLIIISPAGESYGEVFSTTIERMLHNYASIGQVNRLTYQEPLVVHDLIRVADNYDTKDEKTAFFYGGNSKDFLPFTNLIRDLNPKATVYATDDVDIDEFRKLDLDFSVLIPFATLNKIDDDFSKEWIKRFNTIPTINSYLGAKTSFAIAKALESSNGHYETQDLLKKVKQIALDFHQQIEKDYDIDLINLLR